MSASFSWYCARTKPKHEHIAAANLRNHAKLEVFNPRLRLERPTRRGVMRVNEPLFPGYIFVRCVIEEKLNDIRYTNGVSSLVHFAHKIPAVPDSVVEELREHFGPGELVSVEEHLEPGAEVVLSTEAFLGVEAVILRVLPARQRVQVLLDFLGRPTSIEVDRTAVALLNRYVRAPFMAAQLGAK